MNFENSLNKPFNDKISIREEVENLQRKASQLEEYLHFYVLQNEKVLDDSKYLTLELLKVRFTK